MRSILPRNRHRRRIASAAVTGASGFIGTHLVAALERDRVRVLPLTRADLSRPRRLRDRLRRARPDVIFHLAGPSSDGRHALTEGIAASTDLLDATLGLPRRPLVIAVSSSAIYGAGSPRGAIAETDAPAPLTMYGVSKWVQEALARRAAAAGLPVIVARLFNVIGAGQSGERVPATFARQLVALERARGPRVMRVRNVRAGRDLIDVADVVSALRVIAERGEVGETYNVCSGRARRIGDVIDALIARSSIERARVVPKNDRQVAFQRGSARKLRALGWNPQVPLGRSLDAILADWRARS